MACSACLANPLYTALCSWLFGTVNTDSVSTERAWAAGLFDAEGCTRFKIERSGQRRLTSSLPQSGHGRVAEVLTRFQAAVGDGAIYGPWPNGSHVWELRGPPAVRVLTSIWPWLGPVKRKQFCSSLAAYNHALQTPRARALTFVEPQFRVEDDVAILGLAWPGRRGFSLETGRPATASGTSREGCFLRCEGVGLPRRSDRGS